MYFVQYNICLSLKADGIINMYKHLGSVRNVNGSITLSHRFCYTGRSGCINIYVVFVSFIEEAIESYFYIVNGCPKGTAEDLVSLCERNDHTGRFGYTIL